MNNDNNDDSDVYDIPRSNKLVPWIKIEEDLSVILPPAKPARIRQNSKSSNGMYDNANAVSTGNLTLESGRPVDSLDKSSNVMEKSPSVNSGLHYRVDSDV